MITTKLKKECSPKNLLVQFSNSSLSHPLQQFYKTCKQEGIQVRKDNLKSNQVNYYYTQNDRSIEIKNIKLQNVPNSIIFIISLLYINSEEEQKQLQDSCPIKRTLLLRQGLDMKFYHDYEFQNTQSELQSIIYLCQLSASIINSKLQREVDFYDQKTQQIKCNTSQNQRERLWKNIFFQIPGLGKEKCLAITQKYPTYESLLSDYETGKQLKNLSVCKGTKEMKLGAVLANRIYRCLLIENGSQSINDQ